ncbi:MAG: (Fe-S)-binding protein [Eggerthellaceae bacterium]|nr:(Fe-S)-binding protein [Eggerthellaceae bacterium]
MDEYTFEDALAGSSVSCSFPGLEAVSVSHAGEQDACESLFFPGCSFINYAMPLVQSVYDLLKGGGEVDGISLLCCGKILQFEGDGGVAREAFEQQLIDHIAQTQIKRIVAACPNCVLALRKLLARSEETAHIQVVPLPRVLADMGYKIDPESAEAFVRENGNIPEDEPIVFSPKDSCPDRATGEFADALRELMSDTNLVEPKFARKRSYCCGSRPRAAGHYDLGDKMARRHGDHAREVGANVLVTACVSCTYSLWGAGCEVPVYHYLELLYSWNIPWYLAEGYLKLRFLFDDADAGRNVRDYKGLTQ